MKIFITGSNGYIGDVLYRHACDRGHSVVAASRHPLEHGATWVEYHLDSTVPPSIPSDTDVVVHLAADMRRELSGDIELRAAKILLAATKTIGAKFIFISSQTAREGAPTSYGRTKWRIERDVLTAGGWAVRPGQVYGRAETGVFGMIVRLVKTLPLLPVFFPAPLIQPVHVDDLAQGILNLAENRNIPSGILSIAEDIPVTFTSFLKTIVRYRIHKPRLFVPAPIFLVQALGKLFPSGSTFGKSFTRLNSLFALPAMHTACDLETLGLRLRPMPIGMMHGRAGVRRQLLEEGGILLRYVLGAAPSSSLLRRYTRAMEQVSTNMPLNLPTMAQVFPKILALLEKRLLTPGCRNDALTFRLHAAITLAEATPQGARLFQSHAPITAFFAILRAVMMECVVRLLQIFLWPYLSVWERQKGISRDA